MFAHDVLGYQEGLYQTELSRKEKEYSWLETRGNEIYNSLMNDDVVYVDNTPYSMDNIIESVVESSKFKALVTTCLTHTESAGYDLRNLISECGENLALELAQKEFNNQAVMGF